MVSQTYPIHPTTQEKKLKAYFRWRKTKHNNCNAPTIGNSYLPGLYITIYRTKTAMFLIFT
jgi:hypothetical protein